MARKPRVEYEGAIYHVMSRGDHGEEVYRNEADNEVFLDTLDEACGRTGWVIHGFVLMKNH
jgi:REP element-mobilizing transposase RayT